MKELFDKVCTDCSRNVTKTYSTSFSLATRMLSKNIRQDIANTLRGNKGVGITHSYTKNTPAARRTSEFATSKTLFTKLYTFCIETILGSFFSFEICKYFITPQGVSLDNPTCLTLPAFTNVFKL